MRGSVTKGWILAILVVAAGFRFGYLASGQVLPVMWDAGRYAAAAIGAISYLDHSGVGTFADEREDRYRFRHYYEKYIQGEQIEWLHYSPHTLSQARDDLYFSGPLYPALLAVIFYLSPAADFTIARVFGIVLDLLSTWLLILVAVRLAGRTAALLAGFLYAVYFPFSLASTMLLLESSTSFLIILALWCLLRGLENDSRRSYIFAGIITGLLILNKPTAMFLAVPFVAGFYFYARRKLPPTVLVNRLLFFAAPAAVIFVCWVTATSVKYGQLALRDPSYGASNLRQSTSIEFEGYDLDKVEPDFWERSVAGDIIDNPAGFAGLLVKKFERLWGRPFNDFKRSFIIPYEGTELLHVIIVSAGLLGLLVMIPRAFSVAAWPLFIIGYYTAIHVVFHSVSRYNFNAMPMLIMTASFLAVELWQRCVGDKTRVRALVIIGVLLLVLAWVIDMSWFNSVLGVRLSEGVVIAVLLLKSLILIIGLLIISGQLLDGRRRLTRAFPAVAAGLILAVVSWNSTLARDNWSEFACRLDHPGMKAGSKIYVSGLKELSAGEGLFALLDVNSGAGRRNTFTVTVGDTVMSFVGGEKPLLDFFYPKPTYRAYSALIPIGLEEYRQYAMIPLSYSQVSEYLQKNGCVDISVAIDSRFPEENNFVDVHGSFIDDVGERFVPGIRFTSIERFVHRGDPRIRYHVKVLSDSTISYYIDRRLKTAQKWRDLSPSPGLQTGRYNIFLVHFRPDGSFFVY
ncbi:MAG: glycosyltransferase family 39 protein [candidate division Zixibacteria bacterium]|nr:glycosyltransferase family 39 protein [candidate division Zixibacteria bacterium]